MSLISSKRLKASSLLALALVTSVWFLLPRPAFTQSVNDAFSLISRLFGLSSSTVTTESDVTVGTTAVQLTKNDGQRVEQVVADLTATNCTVSHKPTVTTTTGFPLNANGGVYSEDFRSDLMVPTQALWAVCGAAGQSIHVIEVALR